MYEQEIVQNFTIRKLAFADRHPVEVHQNLFFFQTLGALHRKVDGTWSV